ncbi:hypothetical protein NXC14_PC00762 (plasmid) [Rhizobium sp. NXC14]|uniref:hypothetical protein n=1 Tax=Rhizobium sp. NXC14 TaxID=1981173 RepID=UPI000A209C65|nr:hypothetical protein [Rhizobium sp. NXC14]ARO34295.1 hypothetical protein NXC14_PC00762 [Rhizobium sp. NXC14]
MQQSMRTAFINDQLGMRNEPSSQFRGNLQRGDLIVAAVDYQCGDGDLLQVVEVDGSPL